MSTRRSTKRFDLKYIFSGFIILALLAFSLFFLSTLSDKNKINVAIKGEDGAILVSSFDPDSREITTILVPPQTQLDVSHELGKWKAKSIWQLGINEKLTGELLPQVVTKNFHLPLFLWADSPAIGFSKSDLRALIGALVLPYKTNLSIIQRIKLFSTALGVKNFNKTTIDLSKTSYLRKTKLADGENGFVVTNSLPSQLIPIFSDPEISQKKITVEIIDASGEGGFATEVGETIEIMGAKIAAVTKVPQENFDCLVWGKDREIVSKIAAIFSCKRDKKVDENFDIEIKIGKIFAQRF